MTNCSFCGSDIVPGTGKLYIKRDASQYHFCSSKCQRNQVGLGRTNRHVKWTAAAHAAKAETLRPTAKAAKAPKPAAKVTKGAKAKAAAKAGKAEVAAKAE